MPDSIMLEKAKDFCRRNNKHPVKYFNDEFLCELQKAFSSL